MSVVPNSRARVDDLSLNYEALEIPGLTIVA
jgi:hypothetical protein